MLRDVPGWICWQVGAPQRPSEHEYLAEVRGRASELGVGDRIRFLGQRSQAELAVIRQASDIYCQPNIDPDSFGLTLVEALSSGLPVITSALGGPLEIITPECGILIPPGRADDLAMALRRLITDPAERRRLAGNGPARASALCEPRQQVRRLADLLRAHLAARGRIGAA
jgi:glycosyltransferase involved in cell wall biosynthesis